MAVSLWSGRTQAQTGGDTSSLAVRGQMFNALGAPVGGEFLVNTATANFQFEPSITALADGGFVMVWAGHSQTGGDTSSAAVRGQMYNAVGAAVGGEFLVNTRILSTQFEPSITALDDGGFFVVWTDDSASTEVRGQRYDSDGTRVGTEILIGDATNSTQQAPDVTVLSDGRIVVAFRDSSTTLDPSGTGIVARILDPRDATIDGTNGDDVIVGRLGTTEINGHDGDDTLIGMADDDTLNGGSGMTTSPVVTAVTSSTAMAATTPSTAVRMTTPSMAARVMMTSPAVTVMLL